MSFNEFRLAINLFGFPAVCVPLSMLFASYASSTSRDVLSAALAPIASWAVWATLASGAIYSLWSITKIAQAIFGFGELCHNCAMPTRLISPGRYSPHYRCLACGTNRRAQ